MRPFAVHKNSMEIPSAEDLREKLRLFLEVHCRAKILASDPGQLSMYVLHAKNQASKPKDKTIVYLLLRLQEQLLDHTPGDKERVISEFLLQELFSFYKELKGK